MKDRFERELVIDFRKIYKLSLFITDDIEAFYLIESLLSNSASELYAKKNRWKYPMSTENLMMLNILDTLRASNWDSKRRGAYQPLPRPYDPDKLSTKMIPLSKAKKIFKIKTFSEELTEIEIEKIKEKNKRFIEKQRRG